MGIIPEPKYNANNPPPFHLNVTEPKSYGYPVNEDYGFNNNPIYQKKMNNIETSNKDYYNNNQNFNYKQNKNTIGNTNNLLNEGINKGKSKKDDFSIDINILTKDKVEVMIPIKIGKNQNKIWKKEYNKKELIGTVINDYLTENELNLPDDFFSELKCFNKPVSFQDEINSLLPKETDNHFEEIKEETVEKEDKYPEMIGKPFYNPFHILCFIKNQKKFITLNYIKGINDKEDIEKFNESSTYCNGNNHLYISGGENSLNNFLDISLRKNLINILINDMPPKKNHSMIYIKKKIVFVVGGNSLRTFYYNIKEKKMIKWGNLNIIRIEPALQVINNKLYCFSINPKEMINDYSFEITDLNSEPKWEFIKPKINFNLTFNQRLFGCAKNNNNIIFLGGILGENNNNLDVKKSKNFMLNISKNEIVLSDVKYKKFNLKEKGFHPFNKTYDCILTDFPHISPQICFFNKKKSKIELINFSSDLDSNDFSNNKGDNISNITPVFSFGKNNINLNENSRNPNKNKIYNTVIGNYSNKGINAFTNNYENSNNNNYFSKSHFIGKTPEKNMNRFRRIVYTNSNIYSSERNHSYDSRKFYYPKQGLKTNKNIYNYYQYKNK